MQTLSLMRALVEVSEYMNNLFDSISVGGHPDVVASERIWGADIANPERTDEAAVLDAVMLSDGSLVGRDGDDCTQVLQSIKDLLADKRNTVVGREAQRMIACFICHFRHSSCLG